MSHPHSISLSFFSDNFSETETGAAKTRKAVERLFFKNRRVRKSSRQRRSVNQIGNAIIPNYLLRRNPWKAVPVARFQRRTLTPEGVRSGLKAMPSSTQPVLAPRPDLCLAQASGHRKAVCHAQYFHARQWPAFPGRN